MDFKKLKGLTIQDVIVEHHTVYDDDPTVVLWMDNGRKYRIEGGAEEGTDESANEWRGKLTLSSVNVKREPEYRVDELKEDKLSKMLKDLDTLTVKDREEFIRRWNRSNISDKEVVVSEKPCVQVIHEGIVVSNHSSWERFIKYYDPSL